MNVCKEPGKIRIMKDHRDRKKLDRLVLLRDVIVVWVKSKMIKLILLQDRNI